MLPAGFREMMVETFPEEVAGRICSALEDDSTCASTSIRLNPFKSSLEGPREILQGASLIPMSDELGFRLPSRPSFVSDPLFHQGAYYVQDSSSMIVGEVFRRLVCGGWLDGLGESLAGFRDDLIGARGALDRPVRILDLCAAPGGKTTDLSASARKLFGDNYLIVANETISSRAGVLKENVTRWGDPNVVTISHDPSRIASALGGWFDIVLTDVPCSGEGMFRKEAAAMSSWRPEAVENCVGRSKRILSSALDCLREGGLLIYSTCTFNHRENEEVPADFVSKGVIECCTPEFDEPNFLKTRYGYTLAPGYVDGEGQSVSAFKKIAGGDSEGLGVASSDFAGFAAASLGAARGTKSDRYAAKGPGDNTRKNSSKIPSELTRHFNSKVVLQSKGNFVKALPVSLASEIEFVESGLSVLSSGVLAFEIKGRDIIPQQDLAWSIFLQNDSFPCFDLDRTTALKYLSRENIFLPDAPTGIILLTFGGLPLSFCKNIGNRVNNLYPKNSAIRVKLF